MNRKEHQRYLDLLNEGLRREWNPAEQVEWTRLADQFGPAAASEDLALNRVMARLSDVPVPTNFSSRVMAAVLAPEKKHSPRLWPRLRRLGWPAWTATTAAMALAVGLSLSEYRQNLREERAQNLAALSTVLDLLAAPSSSDGSQGKPAVEMLLNFETIQRLSAPGEDLEMDYLLTALQ